VWELVSRPDAPRLRTVVAVGAALVFGPLLVGLQLVPGLEVARVSVRNAPLTLQELSPQGFLDWAAFRGLPAKRDSIQNPFVLVPCLLTALSLSRAGTRRRGLFYLA